VFSSAESGKVNEEPATLHPTASLARWVLCSFVITFVAARSLVLLMATRRIPIFFLNIESTHVHHLNYGIFLLAGVGAYLLFCRPRGYALITVAVLYGVGLALTFDEFGMWLHLDGDYWQRASYDAVAMIAALLALIVAMPRLRQFQPRHWVATALVIAALGTFTILLIDSFRHM
jgi:hypothetical protein